MQSVAVSPHVRVRMTPRGQGSIAAAPPGRSLSVDGGDPGPGRRLRGEGLGPESTSGLSPPPGFRTTGVGVPRPRPPPHTHPGACSPEATSGPRPRPRSRDRRRRGLPAAARFGSASPPPPRRRAAAPPPDTKPVRGPARPRGPFLTTPGPGRRLRRPRGHCRGCPTLPLAAPRAAPAPVASEPTTASGSPETVGRRRGLRWIASFLFFFLFCSCPPQAALRPAPSAGDTSAPGTMADAAWLRASAPTPGSLKQRQHGRRTRGGAWACADRRAGGGAVASQSAPARPRDLALCDSERGTRSDAENGRNYARREREGEADGPNWASLEGALQAAAAQTAEGAYPGVSS